MWLQRWGILGLLALPVTLPTRALAQTEPVLALRDVNVIDVTNGQLLPQQTVVITGNRIRSVGPAGNVRVPKEARVVDGRGKYLIPGLWDMHSHLESGLSTDSLYGRYIAHGVTGIRELGQVYENGADSFRTRQREVEARRRVGPRNVGPSADLEMLRSNGTSETPEGDSSALAPVERADAAFWTPDKPRYIMDSLKAAGDAFVKFHGEGMKPDLFFRLLREARRVGLPMVGHVPVAVTNVEAADSGLRSVEHANETHQCWTDNPDELRDSVAAELRCAPVVQAYLKNGTWVTPTVVFLHYMTVALKEGRATGPFGAPSTKMHVRGVMDFVGVLHRLGVRRFLAGTDCVKIVHAGLFLVEDLGCPVGFSVLQELIFLAGAGLTPLEALQAGTLNPALFFNATDSLGTVAAGKVADLVLLDANPLVKIENVMQIRAVIANGRYFDRAALDSLDPDAGKLVKDFTNRLPDLVKPSDAAP